MLLAFGLAGCAQRRPPPPAPQPAPPSIPVPADPAPTLSPAALAAWADAPLSPGNWSWQPGRASFGEISAPLLTIACESAGRIAIDFHLPGAPSRLVVRTSTGLRAPNLTQQDGRQRTRLAANDPLLDDIVFSRGRFAVEAEGRRLVIPAWPKPARVIEDCRDR
ncbi:MAG: hypothetical protein ACT4OE_02580 [Sphingosinicella sp.]